MTRSTSSGSMMATLIIFLRHRTAMPFLMLLHGRADLVAGFLRYFRHQTRHLTPPLRLPLTRRCLIRWRCWQSQTGWRHIKAAGFRFAVHPQRLPPPLHKTELPRSCILKGLKPLGRIVRLCISYMKEGCAQSARYGRVNRQHGVTKPFNLSQ